MSRIEPGPFASRRPLIGVIHLPPLPGAPGARGDVMRAVIERAGSEAHALAAAGLDGVIVENYGDVPFHPGPVPPETVAALTLAVAAVRRACDLPVGINALRNDAAAALGIAAATGGSFIRVNVHTGAMLTDQGWIAGAAHETVRRRARLAPGVAILADVLVKHATPPPGLDMADAARDTWYRGLADGLIITGVATGEPADVTRILAARDAVPDAPLWLGSGLDPDNAALLLPFVHGAIVGSALREDGVAGRPLDPVRIAALVAAVRSIPDTVSELETP
jgi:membrane complex biogenesis BtpA family protein